MGIETREPAVVAPLQGTVRKVQGEVHHYHLANRQGRIEVLGSPRYRTLKERLKECHRRGLLEVLMPMRTASHSFEDGSTI